MAIKRGLLLFLLHQILPATLVGLPIACLYVLFSREVIGSTDAWPFVFILAHSLVVVQLLGRVRSPSFAFIYSRGYSRDTLWLHITLASAISILLVWLPAALMMWTNLRSFIQDRLFVSPYFPIMVPREAIVPWSWLLIYIVLVPVFHYSWIRKAQPTRGRTGGTFLAAAVVVSMFTVGIVNFRAQWFWWLVYAACTLVAVTMLLAGRKLHQSLEVQA